MDSRTASSAALFLALNLLFFTLVSSTYAPHDQNSKPSTYSNDQPNNPSTYSNDQPNNPSTYSEPAEAHNYKCDGLNLGVCLNLLNLLNLHVGNPPDSPCCSLIAGLVDLEAAVCLCTTIKARLGAINLVVPVDLTVLFNHCGKQLPEDFLCA